MNAEVFMNEGPPVIQSNLKSEKPPDTSRLASPSRIISLKEALYGESKFKKRKLPNLYDNQES
jgi:hypothetical protein